MRGVEHKMESPEYQFRRECPKCDNPSIPRKFIRAPEEYLLCDCDICGFICTMQTFENVFKAMGISLRLEEK